MLHRICLWFPVYLFVYLETHGEDIHCDMESVNLKELQKFCEEIVPRLHEEVYKLLKEVLYSYPCYGAQGSML